MSYALLGEKAIVDWDLSSNHIWKLRAYVLEVFFDFIEIYFLEGSCDDLLLLFEFLVMKDYSII